MNTVQYLKFAICLNYVTSFQSHHRICKTCAHYVPDDVYSDIGRCRLFHNGCELEFAIVARLHPQKCNLTLWENREFDGPY